MTQKKTTLEVLGKEVRFIKSMSFSHSKQTLKHSNSLEMMEATSVVFDVPISGNIVFYGKPLIKDLSYKTYINKITSELKYMIEAWYCGSVNNRQILCQGNIISNISVIQLIPVDNSKFWEVIIFQRSANLKVFLYDVEKIRYELINVLNLELNKLTWIVGNLHTEYREN